MTKSMDVGPVKAKIQRLMDALQNGDIVERAGTDWIEQDFEPLAKQLVPVDTGELRDSIGGTATPHGIRVFAEAPHARHVEEGTSTHRAQPFLGPSVDRTINKLLKRIQQEIRRYTK